jgi:hypothetical protein
MMRYLAAIIACLVVVPVASAEEIRGSAFESGNWGGSAYTQENGTFSHCALSTSYVSGDVLYFSVTENAALIVGMESPRLSMTSGAEYPVSVRVDRRYSTQAIAAAINENTALVTLFDFDRAMEAFRFGNLLTVEGNGFFGEYILSGTAVALGRAYDCALQYLDYRTPTSVPQAPPVPAAQNNSVDRTYLFQAATLAISELGLSDFEYLTEAEMTAAGVSQASVFWFSESADMMGGVFIELANGTPLRQSDSSDTEILAASCDGDFASSARDLDGYTVPVREIRLLCFEEDQPHEVLLTKLLVGEMILYSELRFFDTEREVANRSNPQTQSDAVIQRLASFVIQ